MIETIASIISGAIIIYGIILRIRTINTYKFIKESKVTLFVFLSLGIGLTIVNWPKADQIFLSIPQEIKVWILIASCFIVPTAYRVINGYTLYSAFLFDKMMFIVPAGFIISAMINDTWQSHCLANCNINFIRVFLFIIFIFSFGFIHSLLGSALAGFNMALIVSSFFSQGVLNIDLGSVFDILSILGIEPKPLKWIIIITSTILGVHSSIDLDWIKEKVQ